MPWQMGNTHPRFWSWYMGNGTAFGALGDFLAAIVNPNMGGGNHVGNLVENQVLDWCKQIVGLPPESSGLLVSGGSMANLVGLAVARSAGAAVDVRAEGVAALPQPLAFYASVEVHSCVQKALELLGHGAKVAAQDRGRRPLPHRPRRARRRRRRRPRRGTQALRGDRHGRHHQYRRDRRPGGARAVLPA